MYGFVIYVITTALMIFRYSSPDAATPAPDSWRGLWAPGAQAKSSNAALSNRVSRADRDVTDGLLSGSDGCCG